MANNNCTRGSDLQDIDYFKGNEILSNQVKREVSFEGFLSNINELIDLSYQYYWQNSSSSIKDQELKKKFINAIFLEQYFSHEGKSKYNIDKLYIGKLLMFVEEKSVTLNTESFLSN